MCSNSVISENSVVFLCWENNLTTEDTENTETQKRLFFPRSAPLLQGVAGNQLRRRRVYPVFHSKVGSPKKPKYLNPDVQRRKHMHFTSLILAGGKAQRLDNREKALLLLDGTPFLEVITDSLKTVSSEIIVSLRDKGQMDLLSPLLENSKVVFDSLRGKGPLAGILEGFKASSNEYVFVTACDMPFVNLEVIDYLFNAAQGHDAALIRNIDGRFQSIYAVYRAKAMIPEIEKSLAEGKNFILAPVFELEDVVAVDISEIRKIDPELKCLVNINTVQDLKKKGISIAD